jgi:membrane associated rhomboid family serine protease
MTPASVGFQCPECVAAGRAATREPTNLMGGRFSARPTVTYALIGINAAVYVLGYLLAAGGTDLLRDYGMWPVGIAVSGEWWRLLTAAFLHSGLLHIGFNMYVLYLLGPPLERALGAGRFVTLYLVAALGGSVASYATSPPNTLSVGASGAVFGLMAAILVVGRRFRHDVSQVAFLLAINLVIGFVVPNIDWRAHLGGAAAGAAMAVVMAYAPRANRTLWQILGTLAVLAVLVLVTIARTAELQSAVATLVG